MPITIITFSLHVYRWSTNQSCVIMKSSSAANRVIRAKLAGSAQKRGLRKVNGGSRATRDKRQCSRQRKLQGQNT